MNDPEFRVGDDGEIENLSSLGKRKQKPKEGVWQRSVPIPLPIILFLGGAVGLFVISLVWLFILSINRDRSVFDYDELSSQLALTVTARAEIFFDQRDDLPVETFIPTDDVPTGNQNPACESTTITSDHRIVFSAGEDAETSNLFLSDTAGENVCQLTGDDFTEENYPAWSPDGSQIAFRAIRDSNLDIYVLNLSTWTFSNLTYSQGNENTPTWSPDGSEIAFTSDREGIWNIFMINIDGSNLHSAIRLLGAYGRPQWSPDGSEIIFDAPAGEVNNNSREIFSMAPDGSRLRRLTNNHFDDVSPAWSPDNSRIVFTLWRSQEFPNAIYTMNSDGENLQQVPFEAMHVFDPLWISNDQITFGAVRDGNQAIWTMNADGSDPAQLMLPLSVTSFDWLS